MTIETLSGDIIAEPRDPLMFVAAIKGRIPESGTLYIESEAVSDDPNDIGLKFEVGFVSCLLKYRLVESKWCLEFISSLFELKSVLSTIFQAWFFLWISVSIFVIIAPLSSVII